MATAERSAATSTVGSPLVRDLGELRAADLPSVGGKAANLGELISAGLPVPGGFCVTTAAYARAATDVDTADPVRARELLRSAPLPDDVATAVVAAYRRLCARDDGANTAGDGKPDVPVAVRSSATAEDLPTASFAGQQDTYLNVVGREGSSTPCAAAGPRCGRTAPSPTAPTSGSTTPRCGSRWWSSGWSTRRSPGCCSPRTR